jgi:octaprenyl-diphosphate synthase
METLADVTLRMTEGEMLQTRYAGRIDLTMAEHLDLIERKTAALFGACCEIAGMLAGVGEAKELALRRYGRNLGMAFQVVDDLLDFTGDPQILGKPAASDLGEGKVTLAVIDLLGTGSRRGRELAGQILENGMADAPEIAELRALLRDSGALSRARGRAQEYAAAASSELGTFSDSVARRALETVPDLLVFRDR